MEDSENGKTKKNKSAVDRIIMGAIIGTAIGSALGMTMAPKKGSETRELLKEKTKDIKEVGKLGAETTTGFLKIAKRLLFGAKKKAKDMVDMKKIPHESDIIPKENVDRD